MANIIGTSGNDNLIGTKNADTLDGLAGDDTMSGGAGNDVYIADSVFDVVTELAGAGIDTVKAWGNYALGANVENLELMGTNNSEGHGNELANKIKGNAGNNVLSGNAGADTLAGGAGNDVYFSNLIAVGSGAGKTAKLEDSIIENANAGNDMLVLSGALNDLVKAATVTLAANLEILDAHSTGLTKLNLTGNSGNNRLDGNDADNVLDGGAGIDTLRGNAGNDIYLLDNSADQVSESFDEGIDTVKLNYTPTGTYVLGANIEDVIIGGSANINATGNEVDNYFTGNSGKNLLTGLGGPDTFNGGAGADTMIGGLDNDTYIVDNIGDVVTENPGEGTDTVLSSISYILGANLENLSFIGNGALNGTGNTLDNVLIGNSANNRLYGLEGSDEIRGGAGNDTLDGGSGMDAMYGGAGNDVYIVDDAWDAVIENASEGTDSVKSWVDFILHPNAENLELTGTSDTYGGGNVLANNIKGNAGNNILQGYAGVDTVAGGAGDDSYWVNLAAAGSGSNKTVKLEDSVTEGANAGNDTIVLQGVFTDLINPATLTLAANLENVDAHLTGLTKLNLSGNSANNLINGNDADNILNGGGGADTLIGGAGYDIYVLDNPADQIFEYAGEGIDTIKLNFTPVGTYVLGTEIEDLIIGGSANINVTGNEVDNFLTGNSGKNLLIGLIGPDTLNGGVGADTMIGGSDDDTYLVDNVGDVVIENPGEGIDAVQSFISYALGANLEGLTLVGAGALNATGNALNNALTGNSANNHLNGLEGSDDIRGDAGNDTLDGGIGVDVMYGGAGNDVYIVDNASDAVYDDVGKGTDTVRSSISYTLTDNVENLELTGMSYVSATGNDLANNIRGNGVDNEIMGRGGIDTLAGGGGNDDYGVNLIASGSGANKTVKLEDVIIENANAGNDALYLYGEILDLVKATTLSLAANLENVYASNTGLTKLNLTGNSANNLIVANNADNILNGGSGDDDLYGYAGNDTLIGGAGNDSLIGATGLDHFVFNTALNALTNVDTVDDFAAGSDKIDLDNDIFKALGVAGSLHVDFLHIGAAAADANDFIIYNNATGQLFYDANGSGAGGQTLFAQLDAGLALSSLDFNVLN